MIHKFCQYPPLKLQPLLANISHFTPEFLRPRFYATMNKRPKNMTKKRSSSVKYEYKCLSIWGLGEKTSRVLNEYGKEGWELVAVWGVWHYLKRPKK